MTENEIVIPPKYKTAKGKQQDRITSLFFEWSENYLKLLRLLASLEFEITKFLFIIYHYYFLFLIYIFDLYIYYLLFMFL